jgi:hypothetical protein
MFLHQFLQADSHNYSLSHVREYQLLFLFGAGFHQGAFSLSFFLYETRLFDDMNKYEAVLKATGINLDAVDSRIKLAVIPA